MTDQTDYYFLPYLRRGLSTAVTKAPVGPRIEFDVTAHVEAKVLGKTTSEPEFVNRSLQLFGPGDIVGFDSKLVVRTDPQPHVGDFESNYFPALEFAEPDFPWRFTPAPPSPIEILIPWIALIVLRVESPNGEGSEILSEGQSARNQVPFVSVNSTSLPDFEQSWQWAHVQITPGDEEVLNLEALRNILTDKPERAVGRLLCARKLQPRSAYRAFVVPTFEAGWRAGLEKPVPSTLSGKQVLTKDVLSEDPKLPYYFSWEFRTGSRGDFESLVRLLEPRTLSKTGLGVRKISARAPGYGLPGVGQSQDKDSNHINMEGALQPLDWKDMAISAWGQDVSPIRDLDIKPDGDDSVQFTWTTSVFMTARIEITGDNGPQVQERVKRRRKHSESLTVGNGSFTYVIRCQDKGGRTAQVDGSFPPLRVNPPPGQPFREALAKMVLNRKENLAKKGQNDFPWIVPPIYGQWHTQRSESDPGRSSWLDELNLDPRHRVAAGAGAQVIRDQQEALMASAWDQVGDIEAANELIRHAQLGCELSLAVHDRMQLLKPEDYLRVVGSKMKCIPWDNPARATPSPRSYTVYGKLLADRAELLPAIEPTFARVTRPRGALRKRQYRLPSQSMSLDVLIRLNAKDLIVCGAHPNPPGIINFGKILKDWDATSSPNKSRVKLLKKISSAKNATTRFAQPSGRTPLKSSQQQSVAQFVPVDLIALGPEMFAKALNPLKTIPSLANQRLQFRGMPVREKVQTLDLIMAAPRFPQSMYEGLREVSQDFILPGLEKVPNNTLSLLKPNMRFIEAYFCGLNHEFSKELEWREYPTDKKGSYFRQFWDRAEFVQPEGFRVQLHQAQAKYLGYQLGKKPSQISDEEALDELLKDIKPISEWKAARLGENRNVWGGQQVKENLVLLIRGDLLRKYPNTVIYAVEAWDWPQGSTKRRPAMREYLNLKLDSDKKLLSNLPDPIFPTFSAQLPPDLTFLGFDFNREAAIGMDPNGPPEGYFFVLEERLSEARFGLDVGSKSSSTLNGWNDLSWGHFPTVSPGGYLDDQKLKDEKGKDIEIDGKTWNKSSGAIASITLQRPVRIAVHASQMIADFGEERETSRP